jgi:hypothetical protein
MAISRTESYLDEDLETTDLEEKISQKEELDSLLKLAEELREKYDSSRNLILKLRYIQIAIFIPLIVFWGIYLFSLNKIRQSNSFKTEINENFRKRERLRTDLESIDNEVSKLEDVIERFRRNLSDEISGTGVTQKYGVGPVFRQQKKIYDDSLNKLEDTRMQRSFVVDELSSVNGEIEKLLSSSNELSIYDILFSFQTMILFTSICLASIIVFTLLIVIYNKKFLPDKLALKEVLQLLREIHNAVAEDERWSMLQRAEFRIRLSRFNLEEKSESAFNLHP